MRSFCFEKSAHIFAAKISMYLKIPYLQHLTSLSLAIALNNWALVRVTVRVRIRTGMFTWRILDSQGCKVNSSGQ